MNASSGEKFSNFSRRKSDDGFCVFIKKLLFAENTKKPNLRSWFGFPLEV